MLRHLLAGLLITQAASAQIVYFSAYLEGAQENPPVASPGHGWGVARFDAGTNNITLYCYHTALSSPSVAAHMHQAPVGVNGGVIVGMSLIAPNTWSGSGVITPAQAAALMSEGMYMNVHTGTNPGGEIRGQMIVPRSTRYTAALTGAQEVPPTGSAAVGTCYAFLHEPENRLVYIVESNGLVAVSAAHVHQAPAGVNGGVIVPLNGSAGRYCGVSDRLTPAMLTALNANGTYVNIHTAAFPGGEIRGQLLKDQGDHFYAVMQGANEVPPVATPAIGSACVTIDANGVLNLVGAFSGLTAPATAAHIHRAPVGTNGPIVVPLTPTAAAAGNLTGSAVPTAGQLADLRSGLWYVNVHTGTNPGGEIRGQLTAAVLGTTYGEGCPTSIGTLPQAGMTGFGCMASDMVFDLYGSIPNGAAINIIGGSRDTPLPIQLPLVGINAPGCHALTDVLLTFFTFVDGFGCAHSSVFVPLDPGLRNIPLTNQWLIFDQPANAAGLVVSNGMTFIVQ